MAITPELLTETFDKYKSKHDGRKEDYFAALFISHKFSVPLEAALTNCAFGNNDYGIDGYFIDKETRNLYLYQFKWSTSYDLFKESYKRLIKDGMERIFGNPNVDSKVNDLISRLRVEIDEYSNIIDKIYICFVFNGFQEKAETSTVLENFREELEGKKHFIDTFFSRNDISLTIQYISNETKKINQVSRNKKTYQYVINFDSYQEHTAAGGEMLHLGFIKLYDLYRMFADMKQRLFARNIRAGLSEELSPNRAIKQSLKDIIITKKVSPDYFTFHHNGVTINAEKLEISDGIATITEPRVLNGAQTITTLSRFIDDSQKNPTYKANEKILNDIKVICKFVTKCEQEFVTQITISNNKQNPVDPWNLRANDLIQLEFDDKFRKSKIFYERQENSFANLYQEDLKELDVATKEIKIKKLAQTLLAFQGEIDKISGIGKVFESDSTYEKTFREEYLKADTRKIILAYKIQFRIGAVLREIESQAESKYYFVRYAKDLVWALIIQGLLNNNHIEDWLEFFGSSLTVEAEFNQIIKDIGTKKIRIILSDLIKESKYQEFVIEEKFSFLKTNLAFQVCMSIAKRRFGWEMLTILDS